MGVPLSYDGQVVGVLYAGARPIGRIGDRAQTLMMEFARTLGPAIGAAMQSERSARLCVQEERQRIARELHDTIGQLLFGIGVSARRARGSLPVRATDLLASAGDFVVVGEASSGAAALEAARREQPDRIILDLRLPDMLAPNLCRELRSAAPGARTVILTAFDDRALLQACLDQGAGILLKDVHDLDLLCALREVRAGRTVVEERVMQHPCNRARQLHLGDDGATVYGPLTPRE